MRDATASLNRKLDVADRARVSDYLDSVREIELRVQKLEQKANSLELPDAPLGPPEDFSELLDVQFEMMALAWQTNRTKVASMQMVEEASMRTYPNLDVHEAFHPISHWGGFPDRSANLRKIQNYHTERFAKFVRRLKGMQEGDGTVLDNSIILFGSNMANSDLHNNDPLPQALIGQGRRRQGQPAPALPAGHAARQHPGHDAAARGRAGAGLREVRRQHRRVHGSMRTLAAAWPALRRCWRCLRRRGTAPPAPSARSRRPARRARTRT